MRPMLEVSRALLAAATVATLAGCSQAESAGKPKADAGGQGGGPPAMPVEVAVARTDTVVDAILATGQIEAVQSIELRPDVEGRIAEILVREGAVVGQGTPLFKVDDAELKAQVAQAEAERDLARQSLARTRDLLTQKASSQSELERAEATARGNEARLDLLKVRLQRTWCARPFAGVVGQRSVSLGDYVTTDTRLALAADRVAAAGLVPGARALRRPAQAGAAGHLPGGRVAWPGVRRARGLRGSGGTAPRAHHHRQGNDAQLQAGAAARHVHRSTAGNGGSTQRGRDPRGRGHRAPGIDVGLGRDAGEGDPPAGGPRRADARLRRGALGRRARRTRSWSAARSGWARARR